MGGACCADKNTSPSEVGEAPVQAAQDTEPVVKPKAKGKTKAKAKPKKADPKLKTIQTAIKEVQQLNKSGKRDTLKKLEGEFDCQKNIWKIMVMREGKMYQGCVEKLTEKLTDVVKIGVQDERLLAKTVEDALTISEQVDDSLSNQMKILVESLGKEMKAPPHRKELLDILERREHEMKDGGHPKSLPGPEVDKLLKDCHLDQPLEKQIRSVLEGTPNKENDGPKNSKEFDATSIW